MNRPYPEYLFDNRIRTEYGPIRYNESRYKFLDRMGKPGSDERRARANELFKAYPDCSQKLKVYSELVSTRATAFDEFMFELLVYEHLTNSGVTVEAIEPKLLNNKCPDFLCSVSGQKFYVEVVTVHDKPKHKLELDKLQTDLDKLVKRCYGATLTIKRFSNTEPLDAHSVRKDLNNSIYSSKGASNFSVEIVRPGWKLRFELFKVACPRESFLSAISYGVRQVDIRESIVEKVQEKSEKYGKLDHPLIIYVNVLGDGWSFLQESFEAMYGSHTYIVPVDRDGLFDFSAGQDVLTPDGICHNSRKSYQLDSVIFFDNAYGAGLNPTTSIRVVNPLCTASVHNAFNCTPTIVAGTATGEITAKLPLGAYMPEAEKWFYDLIK